MSYETGVFSAVNALLTRRREDARTERERRVGEVSAKLPELAALDSELAATAISVARAVMASDGKGLLEGLRLRGEQILAQKQLLLRSAGYPADYLDELYFCPICRDQGYVNGRRCQCYTDALRAEAAMRLEAVSGIPRATLNDFRLDYYSTQRDPRTGAIPRTQMERIVAFCRRYIAEFAPGQSGTKSVFFSGGTGLGKTFLSLIIGYGVSDRGFGVRYGSAADLVGDIEREHFGRGGRETLDALLGCDLLILDDMGAEFSTSFTVATLYNLVNTRLQRNLPTLISTNLSMREVTERYGERFTSRVSGCFEMCGFFGQDIRQLKVRQK